MKPSRAFYLVTGALLGASLGIDTDGFLLFASIISSIAALAFDWRDA